MALRFLWLALCASRFANVDAEPMPIYAAKSYVSTIKTHPNGVLQVVKAPDAQDLPIVHVRGSAYERGQAIGTLMSESVATFITKVFDDYVVALLESVDLGSLPKALQALVKAALGALGKDVAAPLLQKLLTWVADKQNTTVHAAHDNSTMLFDEIAGIAHGVCTDLGSARCTSELGGEDAFRTRIEHVNYLPELIRMSCSMLGATRTATAHGKLVQLRALDFGAVPFSNYGMVVVHHKTSEKSAGAPDAFAMITFPGFVGAVTGLNSAGLVQSEKVSYNALSAGYDKQCIKPFGVDVYGCVPGSYDGEGLPFVIRRFVEMAPTRKAAEEIIATARRTWHVYLGIGDSETMDFDAIGYAQERFKVWSNGSISNVTGQPALKDMSYIDKSVQPEKSGQFHDILKPLVGEITGKLVASQVPHAHGSGDVHLMVVDHGEKKLYVAVGTTTQNGTYFLRKACDAPVIEFDLDDLWSMPTAAKSLVV